MNREEIDRLVAAAVSQADALEQDGRRILLTAGPTCEDIDLVRFLTNRSTGRMGIEAAKAALAIGLKPLLICGPVCIDIPDEIPCVSVRSAEDMYLAVDCAFGWCEMLFMSAAVADYTPEVVCPHKLKKNEGSLQLVLKRTKDILLEMSRREDREGKIIAGFSLDKEVNLDTGLRKLETKNLDLIAVNGAINFGRGSSSVCLLGRNGESVVVEQDTKYNISREIIARMLEFFS